MKHVKIGEGIYVKAYEYRGIAAGDEGYRARFNVHVQTKTYGSMIEAQNAMLDEARKRLETAMDAIDQMRNKGRVK